MIYVPNDCMASVKIAFLGDISLNDDYNLLYKAKEKPFEAVSGLLNECDLVIGNLECLARSEQGENLLKSPRLKTDLDTLNYLKDIKLGLACLANNHVYDNLEEGFIKTCEFLEKNGIQRMGASITGDEREPYIFEKNGVRVGVLNYVTSDTNPNLPADAKVKPNWFELGKVINDIHKLRSKVNHIVVFPHWGGKMEGSMLPDRDLIPLAHKLIDEGADLIIGHHSHTLQPYEIYKGKHIYYSIGNFSFSGINHEDKPEKSFTINKRGRSSVILLVKLSPLSYNVLPHKIVNENLHVKLIGPLSCTELTAINSVRALLNKDLLWLLFLFYEKIIYPIIRYLFHYDSNFVRQLVQLKPISMLKHLRKITKLKSTM